MTLTEIIIAGLKANGYGGLRNDDADGCACSLDDLLPCSEPNLGDCEPCYFEPCEDATGKNCDGCEEPGGLCATTKKKGGDNETA